MIKIAKCAKKALSLRKDMVFRLLVVMTVLLGILCASGAAAYHTLDNVYKGWKLEQKSQLSVYLTSNTDGEQTAFLEEKMRGFNGVNSVEKLDNETISLLLQPYFVGEESFPLPIVFTLDVVENINRNDFDMMVRNIAPNADIDDARELLTKAAGVVELAQKSVIIAAGTLLVMMVLLVTLTVRAGLRGHKQSLAVMQYVGATNGFIASLVIRQVMKQSLIGWALASIITCGGIFTLFKLSPMVSPYIDDMTYVFAVSAPFVLVILAFFATLLTCKKITNTQVN